jgi:DNA (cytosine-5)-methyltransferase 1
MKVLNLYAGIGGNRKLWGNVEVTAVEIVPEIAKIYQESFPQDKVIIADAHQYLLDHYKEFEFIWSSPPCPTHSRTNLFLHGQGKIRYPEMGLYQEIIFLQTWAKCKWVVENVISYYEPLIKPQVCGRHFVWSNFFIPNLKDNDVQIGTFNRKASKMAQAVEYVQGTKERYGFSIRGNSIPNKCKRQIMRNLVKPIVGLHIFNCAFKEKQIILTEVE